MRKNVPFQLINATALIRVLHSFVLAIVFIFASRFVAAQSTLINDLNQAEEESYNEYSCLTAADNKAYFVIEGNSLWVSYANGDGTEITKSLLQATSVSNLKAIGNTLYFTASTADHGMELWKTNGTEAGTVMVKDIRASTASSDPQHLTDVNGTLYFVANNGANGIELWKSNGTAAGTVLVKDIIRGSGSGKPSQLTNVNGVLFFSANNGQNGYELWKSNGTADGTVMVKDIWAEAKNSSFPESLVNVNGTLFFSATGNGIGRELYKSDGTATGTVLVKDIRTGTKGSDIGNPTAYNGQLFFTATDGIYGHELWKSDGTSAGTVLVKDMTPGAAGSHGESAFSFQMANFTVIAGYLYYTAYEGPDYYTWRTDGTTAGTIKLFRTYGPGIGQPRPMFTYMNGFLYFFNSEQYLENELVLYRSALDGSSPEWISDFYVDTYDYYYSDLIRVTQNGQDYLYFWGRPVFVGFKMIKSDGTQEGTNAIHDPVIPTASSNPNRFENINGRIYFFAQTFFYESEHVISTDGTTTQEVIPFQHMGGEIEATNNYLYASGRDWLEIYRSPFNQSFQYNEVVNNYEAPAARSLTHLNGNIYFYNDIGEVYKIDDATASLTLIRKFQKVKSISKLGSILIMRVINNDIEELWRTNGQASGTWKFRTLRSGYGTTSRYYPSATINNNLYFIADNGTFGNEIWRSSGNTSSTVMMADLNTNDNSTLVSGQEFDISTFANFRDSLYVSAMGSDGTWSLWKAAPTATSFTRIMAMEPIVAMIPVGNKMFLATSSHDEPAIDLYITDGTASGTTWLMTTPGYRYYFNHTVANGKLYFKTHYDQNLYVSDGTVCGSHVVDLGLRAGSEVEAINSKIVFAGYRKDVGEEPFAYATSNDPGSACDEVIHATALAGTQAIGGNENDVQSYPNPFKDELKFRVNGAENESVQVSVFTITGASVQSLRNIKCNEDHIIGESWPAGLYVMKIRKGNEMLTHKVVKHE